LEFEAVEEAAGGGGHGGAGFSGNRENLDVGFVLQKEVFDQNGKPAGWGDADLCEHQSQKRFDIHIDALEIELTEQFLEG